MSERHYPVADSPGVEFAVELPRTGASGQEPAQHPVELLASEVERILLDPLACGVHVSAAGDADREGRNPNAE